MYCVIFPIYIDPWDAKIYLKNDSHKYVCFFFLFFLLWCISPIVYVLAFLFYGVCYCQFERASLIILW